MTRNLRDLVTVSPPTFDRTSFTGVDRRLGSAHTPFDRSWLMARFDEGLQIRMLPPPQSGIVLFQPGRLSWRPIDGLDDTLVVHDLRVRRGPGARVAAARLWAGVEDFARYYGFSVVLGLLGLEDGLIDPAFAPGRGWVGVDVGPGGAQLSALFLQGPAPLPSFPRDWLARAASLGPGAVIQTTGESQALETRAARLCTRAAERGMRIRRQRPSNPDEARARAVSPGATFSFVLDGRRIGGAEMPDAAILECVAAQRPS
ncbi:hypothetical protein P6F26_08760 [Roseibacterium sp. SDUM158017]|uniref:hypothetical protein n=1 Tax=Roseicyclus salinarum TaxID=3036773 RepID=UPI002414F285|nr:hypothetical protein [Roseibacterium sp. SDUM158017]MDG4648534.1 hypothetical protein [Roseibacterium sp. SDUM158017]